MKNLLFIFTLLFGGVIFAQQTKEPVHINKNIIKTDITGLLLTTNYHLNASWEHLMSKKAGLQLELNFVNHNNSMAYDDFYMGLGASYRFYFNRHINQMKGFYVAPTLRLHWAHYAGHYTGPAGYDALYGTGGLSLGYQWLIKKKWTLDLYTDWQFYFNRGLQHTNYGNIGLKFGYKF